MKCPKCGYIGLDAAERCRNCGYDLARLGALKRAVARDLPLYNDAGGAPAEPGPSDGRRPFPDSSPREAPPGKFVRPDDSGSGRVAPGGSEASAPSSGSRFTDLDLDRLDLPRLERFSSPVPASVTPPPPERPVRPLPLDLRLEPPEIGPALDLDFSPAPPMAIRTPQREIPAGLARRLWAGVVDLLILGSIDAVVIYLTARLCGLSWREVVMLPLSPLAGMLALIAFGYGVLFTGAGGQTVGKMAAGIRVVTASGRPVDFARAAIRTLACFASAVPVGLGFLIAVFGRSHRSLHDRVGGTMVVRIL